MMRTPSQSELLQQEQASTFSEGSRCSGGSPTAEGGLGQATRVVV